MNMAVPSPPAHSIGPPAPVLFDLIPVLLSSITSIRDLNDQVHDPNDHPDRSLDAGLARRSLHVPRIHYSKGHLYISRCPCRCPIAHPRYA